MEVSILNCLHPILQIWEQAQKVILLIKVTQEEFTLCSELQLKSFFFFSFSMLLLRFIKFKGSKRA